MSTVSANKTQTYGHNGLNPIGLHPLFHPEVCDLFAETVLKSHPLLLNQRPTPMVSVIQNIQDIKGHNQHSKVKCQIKVTP